MRQAKITFSLPRKLNLQSTIKFGEIPRPLKSNIITEDPLRLRTSSSLESTRLSSSDIRFSRTSTAAPFSLAAILFVLGFVGARRAKAVG